MKRTSVLCISLRENILFYLFMSFIFLILVIFSWLMIELQEIGIIFREDYMVEAMEILEMYCDLLLARCLVEILTCIRKSVTDCDIMTPILRENIESGGSLKSLQYFNFLFVQNLMRRLNFSISRRSLKQ